MGSQSTAKWRTPTASIPLLLQPTPEWHKGASTLPLDPLVCTGMPLCTAIDYSCPFTPSAPELEPGHNHINPTALATPHSPSSTQSTHHGPRKTSSGSVRASHSKLPRLRDTRTLPRPRNGHCSQSAQQSNRYYPALKNNAPRDDPTPYCHGFLPGLPITPLLHLLQASQPAPLQRPLPRQLLGENEEPPS